MKSKSVLIIGITLIICAAISFVLIRPPAVSILKSYSDLKKSQGELKQSEERKKITASLSQNKDEINRITAIAQKYIPEESESGDLILELTAIAGNYNLKVEKTSLEKTQTTSTSAEGTATSTKKTAQPQPSSSASTSSSVQNVDFAMSLSGNFADYLNFLNNVESSSRLIVIKSMTVQIAQAEDQQTTFQLVGTAFYKPEATIADNLDNIKVSQETINTFLNLKSYAQPINLPQESGFGRTNPFEGY